MSTRLRLEDDGVYDPYSALRSKIQQATQSLHFDHAVDLLISLDSQTSPREVDPPSNATKTPHPTVSTLANFELNEDGSLPPEKPVEAEPDTPRPTYRESFDLSFGPLHETVMLVASAQGVTATVKKLIDLGSNPNRPNMKGLTPLMKSSGAGHAECVRSLIEVGVELFAKDENGRTALDWARLCDARRCILVLEEAMGKEIESKRSEEFGRIKREELLRLIDRNRRYYELLIQHTIDNDLKAVMKLINNVPFDRKGYKDTLKALGMKHDPPDVPYYIDVETDTGATPLMLACAQAEVSSVEKLLENGAKKDSENRRGHTALSWTCVCGHHQVVAALLSGGVNATSPSRLENKTPLHHAAYNGTNQCVSLLLDHYFQFSLDRRFNLSKKKLTKMEQWDMERNWLKPFEKLVLHKDIYQKTALDWAKSHDLKETIEVMQAAEDRIEKRRTELARENALAQSVPCRLGCGYVDRADRIEKHEVQRCPRRIVGCELCGKNIPANTIPDHDANHCLKRIMRCENRFRGCEESMPFDQLFSHCKHRCMYRRDECRLCHKSMLHHQRDEHEAELCPLRTVSCELPVGLGCQMVLQAKDMREHCRSQCSHRKVKCGVGCGQMFKMSELKKHEEEFCLQPCSWEGCGRVIGPEDVRTLHEKFLCPRRVVKCPKCPIGGLVAERLETHLDCMCPKRKVVGLFDLDTILADQRPLYEEVERGSCGERMQRCRLNYIGRRINVQNEKTLKFETCTVVHYRENDGRFRIQFPDGFRWRSLAELNFVILDNSKWDCGWVSESTMKRHMKDECKYRAVLCKLGCGQRVFERGRVKHEDEQCPKRTVICPLGCGRSMAAEDMMDHTESQCPDREVMCESCGMSMPLPQLEEHMVTDCPLALSRCPSGCGMELKVGRFESHVENECPKRMVTCKLCGDNNLFADEMQAHLEGTLRDQECGSRNILCELCGDLVVAKDMENHLQEVCEKRIITCECGKEIVAETQSDHRILECPAVIRYCSLGCGQKMRVMDMPEHQKTDCKKRHLLQGKLLLCPLGCGTQVSFNEQFTHMTSVCPKRIVECENRCPEIVREEEKEDHMKVCRFRRVTCGSKSKTCLRQVRAWFFVDKEGKKQLVCCENHQNNALMWAVDNSEVKLVNYILEQTENRGLNFETPFGDTPLTKACSVGNVEMIALLIGRAQADGSFPLSDFVNYETCRGKTALSEAAKANNPEAIKLLVGKRAKIDHKTEFYRKTAIDWAANMKCEDALEELKRSYKVEVEVRLLFVKIAMGDFEFCKKMVMDGEYYRLDHVRTLEQEIKQARAELKQYEQQVVQTKDDIETLTPQVEVIKEELKGDEDRVTEIGATGERLGARVKALADALQTGFSNAIISIQHTGKAEMDEILSLKHPPAEVLYVLKAIEPVAQGAGGELAARRATIVRPTSKSKGAEDMEELLRYWPAAQKLLKAKNLSHQLRYYVKSKTPEGSLARIHREIGSRGLLDYDLKYKLFNDLPVEVEREAEYLRGLGEEDKKEGGEGGEDDGAGFEVIAALAKWVKAITNYAVTSEELTDTRKSETLFRDEFDSELEVLKKQRVDAEIAHFRLNLLKHDLEDAEGRVRWAERRREGGEKKLSIAKLFAIVTPSGHSLLSWASAWGNLEVVDCFLDHGAYPGYGDAYCQLCAKVVQFTFRHHLWKKRRPLWCKELAREYRNREMGFKFAIQSMLDQMRKTRERVRMPLTEAFYNGQFQVADSFEKKKMPMYHACLTNVMPSGVGPVAGDPAGNEALEKPMNIIDCATMGKERFGGAVWVHNIGWQQPECTLDPFANGLEASMEVWEYVNGVVEEGRAEMHKRRAVRLERALRKEWGEHMDVAVKAGDFKRMIFCAKKGALIDYQTERGVTPLLRAALEDVHATNHLWCVNDEKLKVTAISYLLDRPTKRPMIDFETDIGHTALTFACYHARLESIEALLDRGCKIDNKVKGGRTALIYAAMNGKAQVVNLLLERGANRQEVDDSGKTANDWAFERNFSEVLANLAKERGGDKGVGKAAIGEAEIRIPCSWGCGKFMSEAALVEHVKVCDYRLVECKWCDTLTLQAKEKEEHETKLCKERPTECPLCGEEMLSRYIHNHANNECLKRLERCKFCNEQIRFNAMAHHTTNICKMRQLPCTNDCGAFIPYSKMASHRRKDCDLRRVRCLQGCGQEMWAKDRASHESEWCPELKIACEFCGETQKRQQLLDHTLVCDQAPVKCKNIRYGCEWKGPSRLLKKHIEFACDHTYNKPCPLGCNLKFRAVEIAEHVTKCDKREVECERCFETIIWAQRDIHAKYECPVRNVPCGQCGEMVHVDNMIRHRDLHCKHRSVICTNNGCYMKLRLADREHHEKHECRRAVVWCRLGCGNTLYNEKRVYHEEKLCEWRFIECPLCAAKVRERDKLDHMEIECVRGGREAVIEFHEKQEAVLKEELEELELEAKKKKDLFAFEKKKMEEEKKRERENPNVDKHALLLAEKGGGKGEGEAEKKGVE
ncbi:hypothetical protein TrLO_g12787 [Triparma laevis f. longispina]|uniref:TRAF-type domain-containing protein n=1 Tax=Triparma laevis f. longispina TaxID=1714387 RepID=A0A9W7DT91_9STRA|nr:hypothetical protein TrLO_g12787 [Triparma laevis f. longispina]